MSLVLAGPSHNTIKLLINNFRTTASAMKNRPPDPVHTVRTPPNIDKVLLHELLATELRYPGVNFNAVWFQHNGATRHTARTCMALVQDMLPGHMISRVNVAWPA